MFKTRSKKEKIKLRLRDQIIVFKQLSFFLKSGVTLGECFTLCSASLSGASSKKHLLDSVRADLSSGCPLWQSLRRRTNLADNFITVIEAGEESGMLRQSLERCGQELVKKDITRKKTISALTYPISIALLSLVLTVGMTFGIFPKIRPLLESMHTALPLPTKILIFISDTISHHWLFGVMVVLGVNIIFIVFSRQKIIRRIFIVCSDTLFQ